MAEYIEREKGKYIKLSQALEVLDSCACWWAHERMERIPAADVRPVMRARWQYKTITVPGGKGQTYAKWCCTACKGKAKERTNYCPNCGADMRETNDGKA